MADQPQAETHQPRRSDAVANRQRLIAAARDAFAVLGAAAEVKDIAERASVGVGTIYRHFGNKDELLQAVILDAADDLNRLLGEAEQLEDPLEALRSVLQALFAAIDRDGWLLEAGFGGQLRESVLAGADRAAPEMFLARILERAIKAGVLREDLDIQVAANLLLGMVIPWKYGELREAISRDEAVDRLLQLVLDGARPRR